MRSALLFVLLERRLVDLVVRDLVGDAAPRQAAELGTLAHVAARLAQRLEQYVPPRRPSQFRLCWSLPRQSSPPTPPRWSSPRRPHRSRCPQPSIESCAAVRSSRASPNISRCPPRRGQPHDQRPARATAGTERSRPVGAPCAATGSPFGQPDPTRTCCQHACCQRACCQCASHERACCEAPCRGDQRAGRGCERAGFRSERADCERAHPPDRAASVGERQADPAAARASPVAERQADPAAARHGRPRPRSRTHVNWGRWRRATGRGPYPARPGGPPARRWSEWPRWRRWRRAPVQPPGWWPGGPGARWRTRRSGAAAARVSAARRGPQSAAVVGTWRSCSRSR